jgi:hypothetical protein
MPQGQAERGGKEPTGIQRFGCSVPLVAACIANGAFHVLREDLQMPRKAGEQFPLFRVCRVVPDLRAILRVGLQLLDARLDFIHRTAPQEPWPRANQEQRDDPICPDDHSRGEPSAARLPMLRTPRMWEPGKHESSPGLVHPAATADPKNEFVLRGLLVVAAETLAAKAGCV